MLKSLFSFYCDAIIMNVPICLLMHSSILLMRICFSQLQILQLRILDQVPYLGNLVHPSSMLPNIKKLKLQKASHTLAKTCALTVMYIFMLDLLFVIGNDSTLIGIFVGSSCCHSTLLLVISSSFLGGM